MFVCNSERWKESHLPNAVALYCITKKYITLMLACLVVTTVNKRTSGGSRGQSGHAPYRCWPWVPLRINATLEDQKRLMTKEGDQEILGDRRNFLVKCKKFFEKYLKKCHSIISSKIFPPFLKFRIR